MSLPSRLAAISLLALFAPGASRAELTVDVPLEWEVALGTSDAGFQKAEWLLEPDISIRASQSLELVARGRLRVDAFDRLEPGTPSQASVSHLSRSVFVGDRADAELRELFVRLERGRTLLTLGKQQVVWGEADGLKTLDVVNPQSFREFILDDFEDSRIPLWTANLEATVSGATLQLLWIPDPTFHVLPEEGALYEITSTRLVPPLPAGVASELRSPRRPRSLIRDSDVGGRLSGTVRGWDLSLNYLYAYADEPALARHLPVSSGDPVVVRPEYHRTHILGGTFSTAFGSAAVRGELVFSSDRRFSVSDPSDLDGLAESGEWAHVIGIDWFGIRSTLASLQLFQRWILDHRESMLRDEVTTVVTLLVRRRLWNDRLSVQMIWLQDLRDDDGLVRPRIGYEVADDLELWVGGDVFYGRRSGVFGQYDRNDRIVVGMRWYP